MVTIRQRPQKVERPKKDLFDTLLQGLAVAQGVFGIKAGVEQAERLAAQEERAATQFAQQQDAKQIIGSGGLTPGKVSDITEKGGLISPVAKEGFKETFIQTPGQEGPPQIAFVKTPDVVQRERQAVQDAKELEELSRREQADRFKMFDNLQNKYTKASKQTFLALQGFKKVEAAATVDDPSGADDLALLFGYMKTIDPTSAVKEGEFANARNAKVFRTA